MTRDPIPFLERTYPGLAILRWAEWDGEVHLYAALYNGRYILADSLALLLAEVQGRTHLPLMLAA